MEEQGRRESSSFSGLGADAAGPPGQLGADSSRFQPVGSARFLVPHDWTVDALVGLAYSTSALPRPVLGEHAETFERDLRLELDEHASGGRLHEMIDFAYELARRPA
jgi:hypothetical protein